MDEGEVVNQPETRVKLHTNIASLPSSLAKEMEIYPVSLPLDEESE